MKNHVINGVNEKSEWIKIIQPNIPTIWLIWEIWLIVQQNSLQVQIKIEFTKWFKCKIHCNILHTICENLHHSISVASTQWFFISKWTINYFNLYLHAAKFRPSVKNSFVVISWIPSGVRRCSNEIQYAVHTEWRQRSNENFSFVFAFSQL